MTSALNRPVFITAALVASCVGCFLASSTPLTPPPADASSDPESTTCSPDLSESQVLELVETILTNADQASADPLADLDLTVQQEDCTWSVFGLRRDLAAVEPLSLRFDRFGRVISVMECCWLDSCPEVCFEEPKTIQLRSLSPSCPIHQRHKDLTSTPPWSLWLNCPGEDDTLIEGPATLRDRVHIRSPEQALEFLRLFSTSHHFFMFQLSDFIELSHSTEYWGQDLVAHLRIRKSYHPPAVASEPTGDSLHYTKDGSSPSSSTKFEIKRFVLANDEVLRITETLTSNGEYRLIEREVVQSDISRFGPLFSYADRSDL